MIQKHVLKAGLRVRIVQNPVGVRQIGTMSIACHGFLADDFDRTIATVFKQIEPDSVGSLVGKR